MPNRLSHVRGVQLILLAFSLFSIAQADAALQCSNLAQLFDTYLKQHYEYHRMTDTLKQHTVEQYIKEIDPSKTILLESDINKIRGDLISNFNKIEAGDCKPLVEVQNLIIKRAKENEDFVRQFVGSSYKLDESIELELDPKKRSYSKNAEEKKDILRKMVHFQISNYLVADVKLPEAKQHLIHRYELITKRLSEKKIDDILDSYAESFALGLDPHSSFLSRDNLEDFQIQMQLSLEGIGASLTSQDGFTVIEELIPGGGAEKSKLLRPKDKIIAVAQDGIKPLSVIDMDLRDVVKLIRGRKGTKVSLTILRQGEKTQTFQVTIVRDKIDIKEQAAKISYENHKVGGKSFKVGIIDLPSFYGGGGAGTRSCSVDMKKLLSEAMQKKVDGIVLDLSRNGGGLLEEAVKIAGLFIDHGGIVATKDTQTNVQILADQDEDVFYSGPLVVLTSRLSASASEILAGALRDYHRALIVGADHTFGKGSVQVVSNLPMDIGGMKVTTGMFFLPGGKSTQTIGVASDIQLPSLYNNPEIGETALDYPLSPQSIPGFTSAEANPKSSPKHWRPVDDNADLKKLTERSKDRVNQDPKFAEIRKEIQDAARNEGLVKLSEIRKKSEAETKKEKAKKHKSGERDELEVPVIHEAVNILVDWISTKPQT